MRSTDTTSWQPTSWQSRKAQQQPVYEDGAALERVVADLARLPPVVVSWEVDNLRARLAGAQRGEAFLLQGGDCAESFADCESDHIAKQLKVLLQMSLVLLQAMKGQQVGDALRVEFFSSHEGLHLLYEQAQTRHIPRQNRWYNLSTHMPWIGMRTATVEGAHVEYFRGIANPIGVKVGAAMSDEWLQELVAILNPQNQPGRLALIHRFGVKDIEQHLPRVIEAVRRTRHRAVWCCDPMHGNTETTSGGVKTRRFENILKELDVSFRIHRELGSILGGAHIELPGEDVTE